MIRPVQTELFAVIGNPVGHSLSPAMMNAAFGAQAIPAVYLALQVDDLAGDLDTLAKMGFSGLSVTIPHKETAFRLASETDETAAAIGAVNTLRLRGGLWEGRNTDWLGANRALYGVTRIESKRALVIGAGGAARAVVYGLKREGATVAVTNRSMERGEDLARAFDCEIIPFEELRRPETGLGIDIVVQCTSVGLAGKEPSLPLSESFFHPGMVVMDTVYRPLRTPFSCSAKEAGATVVSGLEMLLYQGVAQLEWWLGRPIPVREGIEVMRQALMKGLAKGLRDEKED